MVNQAEADPRPICWFEIPVKDTSRAKKFYSALFGWRYHEFREFQTDYWTIHTGEGSLIGGFVKIMNTISSEGTTIFVHVENIQKTLQQAVELGASIVQEEAVITEETGRQAKIRDLDGNTIGLWTK